MGGRERRGVGGGGGEAKLGILMTKKKFTGLGSSLLHLQMNVEISEMNLVVHPVIQRAVELVGFPFLWRRRLAHLNEGPIASQRLNISHIPSKLLTDSTFLNALH